LISGSTHIQVDEYSRKRTEEISEAVAESIKKVVADTQLQQQQLLADANLRTCGMYDFDLVIIFEFICFLFLEIENDFKRKLQEHVAKIDGEKATLLAQLEKELNVRQELILETARKRIDDLNEEANRLKMVSSINIFFISNNSTLFFF
jgi:hypothetical protein